MAQSDYLTCAVCGDRTIYDADLNYEGSVKHGMIADIATLCPECAKIHRLVIRHNMDCRSFDRNRAELITDIEQEG